MFDQLPGEEQPEVVALPQGIEVDKDPVRHVGMVPVQGDLNATRP
jgi:hypothetical protein